MSFHTQDSHLDSVYAHRLVLNITQVKSNNWSLTMFHTHWFTFVDPILNVFLPYLSYLKYVIWKVLSAQIWT